MTVHLGSLVNWVDEPWTTHFNPVDWWTTNQFVSSSGLMFFVGWRLLCWCCCFCIQHFKDWIKKAESAPPRSTACPNSFPLLSSPSYLVLLLLLLLPAQLLPLLLPPLLLPLSLHRQRGNVVHWWRGKTSLCKDDSGSPSLPVGANKRQVNMHLFIFIRVSRTDEYKATNIQQIHTCLQISHIFKIHPNVYNKLTTHL